MQQVNVVGIVNFPMKANDVPLSSMAIFDGKLFHHQSVMTIVVPKEIQKASWMLKEPCFPVIASLNQPID